MEHNKKTINQDTIIKMVILLAVYFFLLVLIPTQRIFVSLLPDNLTKGFALNASIYALPILLAILFFGREVLQNFAYFREKPLQKILLAIVGFVLIIAGNYVAGRITGTTESLNQDTMDQAAKNVPLFYSVLLFAILGPFLEEVIFRHLLIGKMSRFMDEKIAILISYVGFILIHVHTPIDIISYIPVATVLTGAYLLSKKNISFSLLIHMINNLVVVLVPVLVK